MANGTSRQMITVNAEQAAQAAVVLIIYPDGVFAYTANNKTDGEVAGALNRVADHIAAGYVVERHEG